MVFRAGVMCFWILVIGLACVSLEIAKVKAGHRIHRQLEANDIAAERLRILEIRYNRRVSLDLLEKDLEEFHRGAPSRKLN
jgi:hypothetical protein